ncbi:MAG: hypothetical protein KGI97_04460, partial [Alphaproteobacteria bacterium]|nr:hypothetical protein [Alphaproteobacteria bacterium]
HSLHSDDADTIEAKLLLQKQAGHFLNRANIGIEQGVGPHAGGGPDRVFLWSTRYLYTAKFNPGFEIQSDFGKPNERLSFDQQQHYAGPAAYGELFHNVKYEAAYLFGVSQGAAQSAVRLQLEYEMYF